MTIKFASSSLEALEQTNVDIIDRVERHIAKGCGHLSADDNGERAATTALLPSEY